MKNNIENHLVLNNSGNIQYTPDEDKLKDIEQEKDEESHSEDMEDCGYCLGEGQVYETEDDDPDNGEVKQCRVCGGSGKIFTDNTNDLLDI